MPPLLPVTTASFITSDSVNGPGRGARCASFDSKKEKTALCEGTERPRSALWRPSAECFLGSVCREACTRAGVAFYNAEIDSMWFRSEFAAFDAGTAHLGAELAKLKAAQASWSAAMRLLLTATQAASMDDVAARLVLPADHRHNKMSPECEDIRRQVLRTCRLLREANNTACPRRPGPAARRARAAAQSGPLAAERTPT